MEEIKSGDALKASEVLKAYCEQFNECKDGCVFVKYNYDPCSDSSHCCPYLASALGILN